MRSRPIEIRGTLETSYPDVLTPEALSALAALAPLDAERKAVMKARIARRAARVRDRQRVAFLDPQSVIARTQIKVQDAREGTFLGGGIPGDLRRQWIQGTGPAARPGATVETGLRNIAYALLSGADGWMFDGEDALGQVSSMSLDNQRNLKLAIHRDAVFLGVAEQVAGEMNAWAKGFFGRETIADWRKQLDFTTKMFRARGLHLDDRHIRHTTGESFSASFVDLALYVVNNYHQLRRAGSSIVLYLPKIQTAEEAALWHDLLSALERHLGLAVGTIKVYVLVEQNDEIGVNAGDTFTRDLFEKLLDQEYDKLRRASNRDVHDVSKRTTLPIAREIVQAYVMNAAKLPWYIDLLNINLNNTNLNESRRRIRMLADAFRKDGTRITENLDFSEVSA
jgi:malate synthase